MYCGQSDCFNGFFDIRVFIKLTDQLILHNIISYYYTNNTPHNNHEKQRTNQTEKRTTRQKKHQQPHHTIQRCGTFQNSVFYLCALFVNYLYHFSAPHMEDITSTSSAPMSTDFSILSLLSLPLTVGLKRSFNIENDFFYDCNVEREKHTKMSKHTTQETIQEEQM